MIQMALGLARVVPGFARVVFGFAKVVSDFARVFLAPPKWFRCKNYKTNNEALSALVISTFWPNFVKIFQLFGPILPKKQANSGDPPGATLHANYPQKGNLLASLGG